jgi:hypothetical protein
MKRISVLMLIVLMCLVAVGWSQVPQLAKPKIITFDPSVPGPAPGPYQGAQALAINSEGTIAGFFSDSIGVFHGFLRTTDGTLTNFDAPDAGTQSVPGFVGTPLGVLGGQGTYATSINKAGAITGLYVDIANVLHGFLRAPDGTFTEFDAPGAGTGYAQGTNAGNINPAGTISGVYIDLNNVSHGFLRSAKGKFTTFDVPGAGTNPGQGTFGGWVSCLNSVGAVTGWYVDANGLTHAFLRAPTGIITTFDAPGAGTAPGQGTYSWSINSNGAVTAAFVDSFGLQHGYMRTADGKFWVFDAPGAGKGPGQGTVPEGINANTIIVGNFLTDDGVNYGFRRAWNGRITRFSAPGAGIAAGQGTVPLTDNGAGATTGAFFDDNFVMHGFLITW